jgi:uncharacterized protein (UPF0332 family)
MSDYIGDYIHYRIEKSDQAYKDAFLFDSRQKGDYGDMYDFDKETVESLLIPVKEFIDRLKQLL